MEPYTLLLDRFPDTNLLVLPGAKLRTAAEMDAVSAPFTPERLQIYMIVSPSPFFIFRDLILHLPNAAQNGRRWLVAGCLALLAMLSCWFLWGTPAALASLNDDHFDGNIFALYAGNGALVPPKESLAESLQRGKPALLIFYVDDSKDCKQYSSVISQLQAFYGRAASFIPVNVDAIPQREGFANAPALSYPSDNPGYYYEGFVPQTTIVDGTGNVVFNARGRVPFEQVDDAFREVFNLLPRSESAELKRRPVPVNELNTELVEQSSAETAN